MSIFKVNWESLNIALDPDSIIIRAREIKWEQIGKK